MSSARFFRRCRSRLKSRLTSHFVRRLSSWLVLSTSLTVVVGKTLSDAQAANVYWDINGSIPGASATSAATGIWNDANLFWNDAAGIGTGGAWVSGDTAIFAAGGSATGAYTVTVNGTQGIGGLSFEEGVVTLAGGILQMTTGSNIDVATSLTATVNSVLDGAFDLHKTGGGTLVLGGANTYSGRTFIDAGTLSISSDANLGVAPGIVVDSVSFGGNTTLQITGTSNPVINSNRGMTIGAGFTGTVQVVAAANVVSYGGLITGATSTTFRKTGAGTLNLSANSGMAGTVNIDGGTLRLSSNGALASAAGVVLSNRGVFTLDNTVTNLGDRTAGPVASSGGTINFLGNAAATTETLGAITLNPGALTITASPGAGGSVLTIPSITRNAGGSLYVTGTGLGTGANQVVLTTANALTNTILPWAVAGNGTVTRFATHGGNGTSLAPQTTGYTALETAWTVNTVNALPTASQALSGNRTVYSLTLDAGINLTAATSDRSLTIGSGGIGAILQTGGTSTIGQTGTIDNILAFGANEAVFHILGTLQTIRADSATGLTGSAGLTKSGAGTLILGGQSTLTGTYRINEGILEARRADALGASQAIHLNGGTLRLSADSAFTLSGVYTVNADTTIQVDRVTAAATATTHAIGALTIGNGRVLSVSSNDITAGTAYGLTTGALTLTAGGATFDVANNGAGIGTMTVGTLTGAFPITKTGGGDLLTNSTTAGFSNPVDIQSGRVGWSGGSGTVTESQNFFGTGGMVKSGAGQVNLTGNNTFSGGITITAGTLGFSTAANLGTGTDPIALAGGALGFVGSTDQTISRAISVNTASTLSASGTAEAKITYNGLITVVPTADGTAFTFTGNTTSSAEVTGGLTMTGSTADASMTSGNWTFRTTPVTLADDFTVSGASTVLNLANANALTFLPTSADATLQIQAGATLNIGADDAVTASGFDRLLVGQGGSAANSIVNMGNFDLTTARLDVGSAGSGLEGTINGTGDLTVITTLNLGRGTINVNLISSAAVVKIGLGTLTLTGTNILTNTTAAQVAAGNLVLDYTINNTNKLAPTTGLNMSGGTLTLNGSAAAMTTQSVAGTAFTNGASVIALNNGVGQTVTLNLGAFTRTAGQGTIRFELPANGALTTSTGNNTAGASGIFGGYATVTTGAGTFFARNDGANIIAAANTTSQDTVSLWVSGENISDGAAYTGTVDRVAINSLRFNAAGGGGVNVGVGGLLGIASGGILQTSNVSTGPSSISGRLAAGGQEWILITDSATQTLTFAPTISGNYGVTKSGIGTLTLSASNNYSGATQIQAGTLIAGGNSIGDTSTVTMGDDQFNTLELQTNETIGSLAGGNATAGIVVGNILIGTNTLTINETAATTFSGFFTGSGTVIKTGASTLTLQNTGTAHTGTLQIDQGQVTLSGNFRQLQAISSIILNGSGTLLNSQDQGSSVDRIPTSATVTLNNTAAGSGFAYTSNQGSAKGETVGALTLGAGHNVITATATGAAAHTLTFASLAAVNNHATSLVRGLALGDSAITQRGQILFTAAPAGGSVAVGTGTNSGTQFQIFPYLIGDISATGLGNSFVRNTGSNGLKPLTAGEYVTDAAGFNGLTGAAADNVRFANNPAGALTGPATAINSLVLDGGSGITLTGPASNLEITSGAILSTLAVGNVIGGFASLSTPGTTRDYTFYVTDPAGSLTVNSRLLTAAPLVKSGAGTLVLGNSLNSNTDVYFNQGAVQVDQLAKLGSGGLMFFGGTLKFGGVFDPSSKTITIGTGGATFDTNGNEISLASALSSGAGAFTKTGSGVLRLNSTALMSGTTTVSAGSLVLGANQAIGSGDLTVAAGAMLDLGTFNVSVGNVNLPNSATAALVGTGTLTSAGVMTVNQGSVYPVLAGTMNLIKQAASQTVDIENVGNSFTGFTQIQNGTLRLSALADSGETSSLGAAVGDNAAIRLGSTTTTGALAYIGAATSTNRPFWLTGITGGGTIDNDGTGALTLNGGVSSAEYGTKTLTLQGATTGFINEFNGMITETVGVVGLTKAEVGTWRLNGINGHTGGTNINAGTLIAATDGSLGTGAVTFGGTGTLDNNNANRTFANNFVVNGTSGTLAGTGNFSFTGNWNSIGSGRTLVVANTGTTTFGDSNADTITLAEADQARTLAMDVAGTASAIINATIQAGAGTGADGFTKTGAGSLTINAANTYTGATTLDGGTVTFSVDQNLTASTNTLIIGSSNTSANSLVIDLTNVNATFGGAMTVQTNNPVVPNEIIIGATKTLTINNNVTIGSSGGGTTAINFTGGGSMVVSNPAAASFFAVGGVTTSGNKAIADLSGLGSLSISLNTTDGVMRVNPNSGTNVADKFSILILPSTGAGVTTVTAATLGVGDSASNNDTVAPFDQTNQLKLGSGVNTFNVNTVNIGTGGRDAGSITFHTASGSLILRSTTGGPVAFNMGTGTSTTGAGAENVFDVSGHNADLLLGAVNIGTQLSRGAAMTNLFSFDQGTLVMQSLNLSSRNTSGGTTSNFNIGGGTVTSGTITMATTGAAAGVAVANLSITGGTVTLTGNILKGGGAGTDTANFVLNGATASLDLGGFTLGGSGASALDSMVIGAGTLKNVGEINGGAALVKTTSGTLTMDGTNTYTGANAFQNGTVVLAGGGNNRISTGALTLGSGVNSAVLQLGNAAGATSQTLNSLTIAGTGLANAIVGGSSSGSTLTLNVAANTSYDIAFGGTGTNQNHLNLVKTGVGEMTLTGVNNTYTGTTTLTGGKLIVENIGGFSTTSAGLTIGDNTEFTLRGSGLTSTVSYEFSGGAGNKITIGGGAGTAILGFRLDGAFNTQLKLGVGQTLSIVAGSTLQTAVYVDDAPIAGQGYVLIDGASANSLHAGGGTFNFNPVIFNGGSFSYALSNVTSGGVDQWVITPTAMPAAADVWWKGDLTGIATGVWSASTTTGTGFPTNWDTSQSGGVDAGVPPDSGSIVHFSAAGAANFATTLGANLTIQELFFHAGGTAVAIDGNAGLYTLTLGNTVDGSGITLLAGAPNVNISADLVLAQSQSFNIADTIGALTITGGLGGVGNLGINDNGSSTGRLVLSGTRGVATYSGATNLVAGRLVLNGGANNRLPVTTNLTMGNATLGSVLQLGDATDGATNQTIAALNTGAATSNSIVGGAAAVSTLTVVQGTAGTFRGIIGGAGANENNVALVKQGAATLILDGANTYTGGTTVSNGTLQLGATGSITGALTITAQPGATATFDNNSRATVLTGGLTFGGGDAAAQARLINTGGGGSFAIGGNILFDGTNNPLGASIDIPVNLGSTVRTITANDSTTAAIDLAINASLSFVAGTNGMGLTLDGTGTGLINAPLVLPGGGDNSASDLTKNGTGTWLISSTISMSDDVVHSGGTITITCAGAQVTVGDDFVTDNATVITNLNVVDAIQGTSSTSNGLYARSGATINVNANGAIGALMDLIVLGDDNQGIGNLVMNADASIARLDVGFNSSGEIGNVTGAGTLSGLSTINLYNGIVSANLSGSAGNIVKDALNVTLSGINSLGGGTTTVAGGNLVLDYTTNAGVNSKVGTGHLTMGSTASNDGFALLTLNGHSSAASLQTVGNLIVAGGPSTIAINAVSGFDTLLRITGTIGQSAGTINLLLANANSRIEYTGPTTNINGIIGGWFTIGSNRFATIVEGGALDTLGAVVDTVKNDLSAWAAGDNVINTSAFTGSIAGITRINSLTFDAAAASNLNVGEYLILQSGGLLVTSGVGANPTLITGGRVNSESGGLYIHQHNTGGALTIASSIVDNTPLTKVGDGLLVLSGTNQLGALNINGGTVRVSGGNALSDTAAVDIRSVTGATLEIMAGAGNSETMGSLAGDGSAAQLIIGSGATLTVNQSVAETFAGIIGGGGDFVKQGTAILTIQGDASLTGAVTINAGRITLNGGTGRLNDAASYTLNGGELLVVQDQSSSQDRLKDASTITLNNTAGTIGLRIQNTSQNATRTDNVGAIVLGAGHNIITAEGGTGSGTGTSTIADLIADSLTRGSNRATLLVSGLDLGSSSTTRKGYIRFDAAATATVNGFEVGGGGAAGTTNISIIPWLIGDSTTAGLGNSFVTYVDGTTGLRPLAAAEYTSNSTSITGALTSNIRYTASAAITATPTAINSLVLDAATAIALTGSASAMEITSGAILAAGAGAHSIGTISALTTGGGRDYTVYVTAAASTLTIDSPLTSVVPLVKSGAGTLKLTSASNAFTDVYLNQGAVLVNDFDKLGSGALNFAGGILRLDTGFADDLGAKAFHMLTGGGTLDIGALNIAATNLTLTGAGTLSKLGTGTLTINDSSSISHTGLVNVGAGTVVLNNALGNVIGTGGLLMASSVGNTVVRLNLNDQIADTAVVELRATSGFNQLLDLNSKTDALGGLILSSATNAGAVVKTGATGVLTVNGDIYLSNNRQADSGTTEFQVLITGSGAVGTRSVNGFLDLGGADRRITVETIQTAPTRNDAVIETVIRNGGIIKEGSRILYLRAANTYAGKTQINAGTIAISAANNLGDGSVTNTIGIANGGTLRSSGANVDLGGNRSIVLGGGSANLEVDAANVLTVSGVVSGSAATTLNKNGSGTLVLTAANTHTGVTSVNAGELVVGGSLAGHVHVAAGITAAVLSSDQAAQVAGIAALSSNASGGTIDPGRSGGSGTSSIGALTADGNVTLGTMGTAFSANLKIEIGGTEAGTSYDQLNVTAGRTVSLDNVALSLTAVNGYAFTQPTYSGGQLQLDGAKFFVLTLGVGSTLSGTFAGTNVAGDPGLPGYSTIVLGGQLFAINYSADFGTNNFAVGSGNDVALMAIPEPNALGMLAGSLGLALGLQRFRRRSRKV